MKIIIICAIAALLWSLWGYFGSRVEQAEYSVISRNGDYEIRMYAKHIVAQATVGGEYDRALNEGFRIVAGYIFGGNQKKEDIAMTAPVTESKTKGVSIAMTAPVIANIDGESHTIAFGMPKGYTLATLPIPNDARVKLVEVPEKKMAVLTFSWFRTTARVQQKKEELLQYLKRDKVEATGGVEYAGYNAPWTPPWMARHEVLVEVK